MGRRGKNGGKTLKKNTDFRGILRVKIIDNLAKEGKERDRTAPLSENTVSPSVWISASRTTNSISENLSAK